MKSGMPDTQSGGPHCRRGCALPPSFQFVCSRLYTRGSCSWGRIMCFVGQTTDKERSGSSQPWSCSMHGLLTRAGNVFSASRCYARHDHSGGRLPYPAVDCDDMIAPDHKCACGVIVEGRELTYDAPTRFVVAMRHRLDPTSRPPHGVTGWRTVKYAGRCVHLQAILDCIRSVRFCMPSTVQGACCAEVLLLPIM